MGKILESIGLIDGFDITIIGKMSIKKDKMFEEIKKKDKNIQEEARDIINNSKGVVFAIYKKKIIHGLYLFKEETKEKEEKHLKLVKSVFTDDVSQEVKDKYQEHLIKLSKEKVKYLEYDEISLDEDVIYKKSQKSKAELISAFTGGYLLGFLLGLIVFDSVGMGLCFGIIFAPVLAGVDAGVRKKRGRKKNK